MLKSSVCLSGVHSSSSSSSSDLMCVTHSPPLPPHRYHPTTTVAAFDYNVPPPIGVPFYVMGNATAIRLTSHAHDGTRLKAHVDELPHCPPFHRSGRYAWGRTAVDPNVDLAVSPGADETQPWSAVSDPVLADGGFDVGVGRTRCVRALTRRVASEKALVGERVTEILHRGVDTTLEIDLSRSKYVRTCSIFCPPCISLSLPLMRGQHVVVVVVVIASFSQTR